MRSNINNIVDNQGFLLLDGGFATEVEKYRSIVSSLWSSSLLLDKEGQEITKKVHKAYIEAGADVIITNSYQLSTPALKKYYDSETTVPETEQQSVEELLELSVKLANQSIQECKLSTLVCASLGNFGASRADGSEYTGEYGDLTTPKVFEEFYMPRIKHLVNLQKDGSELKKIDVLAFETVPVLSEARVILDLMMKREVYEALPFMIVLSIQDEFRLSSGENIIEVFSNLSSLYIEKLSYLKEQGQNLTNRGFVGIGVNCSKPEDAKKCLSLLKKDNEKLNQDLLSLECKSKINLICYPNKGEEYDAEKHEWKESKGTPDKQFVKLLTEMYTNNVKVLGGCCRTSPETTRLLKSGLKEFNR
eukprot:augustus_masked-scaffold_3-processed-gene-8.3-mRNA-1 protein AED:0.32 eAED:0.35 QI:0/-1/0/1/-1/1/1/0/361